MKSKHPFTPYIPVGAKKLLIGTIPPKRFCTEPQTLNDKDVNFYYGSIDNSFWPLLGEIFNENFLYKNCLESLTQRKLFLDKIKIGITDIIDNCIHENDSASDKDLKEIEPKNLSTLLLEYPEIDTLIYTSEFVKSQIRSIFKVNHRIDRTNKKKQTIKINNKNYQVRILYSPSPQGLRNMGVNGVERRRNQYVSFFKEI